MFKESIAVIKEFIGFVRSMGDDVWAFLLFVLAGGLAIVAHFGHDGDLMHFAEGISMTAATVFKGSKTN